MRLDEESISIVTWRSTKCKNVSISKTRELITKTTRRRINPTCIPRIEKNNLRYIATTIGITSWSDICHDGPEQLASNVPPH
nr:hypothetical protein Iba_chr09dCG5290 [Ipomoea batatas]GMD60925.1 hypothetical protein Iba_scaffold218939CG0010 [Ipomoea batatas]GME12906.1 hypothetical protein Iba_scaffold14238CG0270 [Ipomoea batatas]